MAISRAQLAKELEPGLNALFGLEYDRYENEHAEIFEEEASDRAFEEEVMLGGFSTAPVKTRAELSRSMTRRKHTLLVTRTRQSLWPSQLRKRLSKTTFMTDLQVGTRRLWLVRWLKPSRSRPQAFLTMPSPRPTRLVTGQRFVLPLTHQFRATSATSLLQRRISMRLRWSRC